MAHEGPQLSMVGEKSLLTKCKPGTLAYCPTMDLIALATDHDEFCVHRLNGQRVFGGSFKVDPHLGEDEDDGELRALAWKANGRFLAVACGDGSIRIISAYNGKTVHHYPANVASSDKQTISEQKSSPKITCLGWGVNFTDSKTAQKHLESAGQMTVDDLLLPGAYNSQAAALLQADLPRELALLDIESSLPKLSTLPASGIDDDLFSSRASVDAIFHSSVNDASESVDVLFVGFDDGSIHLRIFDRFEIGSIRITNSPGLTDSCRIFSHTSHPLSSTHALLASSTGNSGRAPLDLVTIDLRFITKSGRYLSLLASKTTQLQNLLRYIGQLQRQVELEWKNAQELPARFMKNVSEDLQEQCQCDFTTSLYHLIMVGNCHEPMREFLVDIVSERGHQRWDKAVTTGYENIRRLIFESLIPAIERSHVLVDRLVGLSKYQKLSDVLGLDTQKLISIVETLDCLQLLAHQIIIHSNEELDQFTAFSRWLRHEIMIQSSDPLSQTMEELLEKRDLFEIPLVLKYVTGALTRSALRNYIYQLPMLGVPGSTPRVTDKWLPDGHDRSFYDEFKSLLAQQRRFQDKAGDSTTVDAPKLDNLTKRLEIQFEKVFAEIALTQRRGILHRSPLTLHSDCDQTVMDLTMCYEESEEERPCTIYVATRSLTSQFLTYIYRVVLDSNHSVSSTRSTSVAAISLQEGEVRRLQFLPDGTLLILWVGSEGPSRLLYVPFQPASAQVDSPPLSIDYTACDAQPTTSRPDIEALALDLPMLSDSGMLRHVFAMLGKKSKPIDVDANGRKNRRAVCILYGNGMQYDVLDMDAAIDDSEEEDGEDRPRITQRV